MGEVLHEGAGEVLRVCCIVPHWHESVRGDRRLAVAVLYRLYNMK